MSVKDTNVESALLQAAKKAFLEEGYKGTSLRKICSDAGVTTGAVYFFFDNKEQLFDRIVHSTVEELKALGNRLASNELEDLSIGVDNDKILAKFLYTHRDELRLLLEKSHGTKYEGFKDHVLLWLEREFSRFFEIYKTEKVDRELIRILAQMRLKGYLEIAKGGYDMHKMLELSEQIGVYADAGFQKLIQADKSET